MKYQIPIGVSDFAEIRKNEYYYVDKTALIEELLKTSAVKVTLITRPRRFGKTIGMSMLSSFFDIRKDSRELFEGLNVAEDTSLCQEWMNQWPTIFLTFKKVDGLNFDSAYEMLASVMADLFNEHSYLLQDERISAYDREMLERIMNASASMTELKNSLSLMTRVMQIHYGKSVILLLDEYDVPVAKANQNGYYDEMLDLMKGLMQALKDNSALRFAVITGCLKIAKESIFTGTNNFVSDTIVTSGLNEYFGFTQTDMEKLLKDFQMEIYADAIKEWYDGYQFGDCDVYCPWDVMNYLRDVQRNPQAKPVGYWKNTSDNAIIRSFIDYAGSSISEKLETLLNGGYIVQRIEENLTYDYLHSSEENLWSVLYLTGYLTRMRTENLPDGMFALTIPNKEIREIFETTVKKWFDDSVLKVNRQAMFDAVWNGDSSTLEKEMSRLLRRTISYHDYKEDFYHAFLAGIFAGAGYIVKSNRESGEGRSDVVVCDSLNGRVVIFEAKYSRTLDEMEHDCKKALQQISERGYTTEYEDDYDEILCYGISFYKKRCMIRKSEK